MSEQRQLTDRGQERRRALLDLASRLFAEVGYHPTSVADIVDGVGVGKGVFYWYFDSKEALLRELLRDALAELRAHQAKALINQELPIDKLEAVIRASLRWSADNPDIFRIVTFGWTEEPFATALAKGRRILIADTAAILDEAMAAGQIAPGPSTILATAIHGVTDELARSFHRDPSVDDAQLLESAVRFCLHGLVER